MTRFAMQSADGQESGTIDQQDGVVTCSDPSLQQIVDGILLYLDDGHRNDPASIDAILSGWSNGYLVIDPVSAPRGGA